jgi:hypothetical protein
MADAAGNPGEVMVRYKTTLNAGALEGQSLTELTIEAANTITNKNNVVTTTLVVAPWTQWWGDDLLAYSQLRPSQLKNQIPIGTSTTRYEYNNQNVGFRQVKTYRDRSDNLILDASEFTETTLNPNGRPVFESIRLSNGQVEVSGVQTQTSLQEVMKENVDVLGRPARRFEGQIVREPGTTFTEASVDAAGVVTPGRWSSNAKINWEYALSESFKGVLYV